MNDKFSPLISIVIPVYNCELYIKETIQSILKQTYNNIECIVVNDGSTDATSTILDEFSGVISVYEQLNSGQSSALNYGFLKAKGEYIGYLSADDLIDNEHIDSMVKLISKIKFQNSYDVEPENIVVFSRYRLINSAGFHFGKISDPFLGVKDFVENFNNLIGPGAIFSRNVFISNGGWDLRFKQIPDYFFWFKNINSAIFCQDNKVSASFRVHDQSQTYASPNALKSDESVLLLESISTGDLTLPINMDYTKLSTSALIFSSCLHIRGGRYQIAFDRCVSAFKLSFFKTLCLGNITRVLSNIYHVLFRSK